MSLPFELDNADATPTEENFPVISMYAKLSRSMWMSSNNEKGR